MTKITDEYALQMMFSHGGSFVQALARLYSAADNINRQRVREAFAEEFEVYRELAELKAKQKASA